MRHEGSVSRAGALCGIYTLSTSSWIWVRTSPIGLASRGWMRRRRQKAKRGESVLQSIEQSGL